MTPFSKNPITFIWRQVAMLYITSVTCDSVEKNHYPYVFLITSDIKMISSYLYSQNDSLAGISRQSGLNVCFDRQSPIQK